ncbi:hypothetical protein JW887_03360 [Candidatus Dojkabacteria bacterium]|nr:hypothetical protein [Candidatus Dojkabacteria bacterium]
MTAIGNDVPEEVFQQKYNEGVALMEKAVACDAQEGNGFFEENRSWLTTLDASLDLQAKDIRKTKGIEAEESFRKQKLNLASYLKSQPFIITLANLGVLYANNGKPELARQYWQQVLDAETVDADFEMEAQTREGVRQELQILNANNPPKKSESAGGCYIATACYGSYDAPEVKILRAYRDKNLSKTAYGRSFIRVYYAYSPFIASLLREKPFFNGLIRKYVLDNILKRIRKQ